VDFRISSALQPDQAILLRDWRGYGRLPRRVRLSPGFLFRCRCIALLAGSFSGTAQSWAVWGAGTGPVLPGNPVLKAIRLRCWRRVIQRGVRLRA
jgi:hypothetical protein